MKSGIAVIFVEKETKKTSDPLGHGKVSEIKRIIPFDSADRLKGLRLYFRVPITRGIATCLEVIPGRSVHCLTLDFSAIENAGAFPENGVELDPNAFQSSGLGSIKADIEIKIVDAMLRAGEALYSKNYIDAAGEPLAKFVALAPSKVRAITKDRRRQAPRLFRKSLAICTAYLVAISNADDDKIRYRRKKIIDVLARENICVKSERDLNKCFSRLGLPSIAAALD